MKANTLEKIKTEIFTATQKEQGQIVLDISNYQNLDKMYTINLLCFLGFSLSITDNVNLLCFYKDNKIKGLNINYSQYDKPFIINEGILNWFIDINPLLIKKYLKKSFAPNLFIVGTLHLASLSLQDHQNVRFMAILCKKIKCIYDLTKNTFSITFYTCDYEGKEIGNINLYK